MNSNPVVAKPTPPDRRKVPNEQPAGRPARDTSHDLASTGDLDAAAATLRRLRSEAKPEGNPGPSQPGPRDLDAATPVVSSSGVGLLCQSVTTDTAGNYGLDSPHGMVVTGIVVGSPASKAGFQQNDVILKIDGKDARTLSTLTQVAAAKGQAHTVPVEILRHGAHQTIELDVDSLHR
jgi:S1-C subfamily serine protease